jgi:hypothetical protein
MGRFLLDVLADAGQHPNEDATLNASENKFKSMIKQPALHLLAAFALIYVGIEVSLGGTRSLSPPCHPSLVLLLYTTALVGKFAPFLIKVTFSRLDCHIHHQRTQWRTKLGLYLVRLLRRCAAIFLVTQPGTELQLAQVWRWDGSH